MTGRERVRSDFADVWRRSRPEIGERLAAIEAAAEAPAGEPDRWEEAIAAAHKLAGVLGTFGLPRGSELARRIEAELEAGASPAQIATLAAELASLVSEAEAGATPDPA
jgi:HPt (histidine-containing phosphotransfer) domain-containing protein